MGERARIRWFRIKHWTHNNPIGKPAVIPAFRTWVFDFNILWQAFIPVSKGIEEAEVL